MTETLLGDSDLLTIDPNKKYLEELVGEDKKFKDAEALARGKYEADMYISTLTRRQDELRDDYAKLREDYNSRAKLEEVLDQLKSQKQLASNENTLKVNEAVKPEIKPEDISNLVTAEIQKHEMLKKQQENLKIVQAKLKERFGDNADALKSQLETLGLTEDFVMGLAKQHPAVVLRTLGLDQQSSREDYTAPPRSSQRSDNFSPTAKKRTWAYYQELRKKDPVLYASKQITNQLHKDYEEQGAAFEDGDFHSRKYN